MFLRKSLAYVSIRDSTFSLPGVCRFWMHLLPQTPNKERLPVLRQRDATILCDDVRILTARSSPLPHITAKRPTSNPAASGGIKHFWSYILLVVLLKAISTYWCGVNLEQLLYLWEEAATSVLLSSQDRGHQIVFLSYRHPRTCTYFSSAGCRLDEVFSSEPPRRLHLQ